MLKWTKVYLSVYDPTFSVFSLSYTKFSLQLYRLLSVLLLLVLVFNYYHHHYCCYYQLIHPFFS